jgi:aspartate aminotransferase
MRLASRTSKLKASPTLALAARAKELAAQGHNVISLTVGEPDWPTYESASRAGIEAIQKNITKYTAAQGTPELRKIIAQKTKEDLGQDYALNEVTVGPGNKFVIFQALQVLCEAGDEVIIQAPYWVSYPTMIELSGATPVVAMTTAASNFMLKAKDFEKHITKKTKAFLFCSPSNPTGLHYSAEELKEFAEVFRRHPDIVIFSDDIYNRLLLNGEKVAPHILHVAPDLRNRVVSFNGGSKAYSMTGWRIGWATGPKEIIQAMSDYQSQATGAPNSISQYALGAAIQQAEPDIKKTIELLVRRKNAFTKELNQIPNVKVYEPTGAFYIWRDVSAYLGKKFESTVIEQDRQISQILLEKFFVGTVPGAESGTNGYLRLSFATDEKLLCEASQRMKQFFSQVK